MKRTVLMLALVLASSAMAFAQDPVVQRAAARVPILKSRMTDPDSFVLEAVYTATTTGKACTDKWCKHKVPVTVTNVCFTFRSHNAMGGYGQPSVAILVADTDWNLLKDESGRLLVIGTTEEADNFSGWMAPEWEKGCQSKKFVADITADVKAALAPPTPPALIPADKAKQAQQYADCLKLAADNPNVVCKGGQQ